jgi:hypothetical protein
MDRECECQGTRILCKTRKIQFCLGLRRSIECPTRDEAAWIHLEIQKVLPRFNLTPNNRALTDITQLELNVPKP